MGEKDMADQKDNKILMILSKLLDIFVVVTFGCMVVFAFAQVLLRYVFSVPAPWTEETARYFMIALIFVGAGVGVRLQTHIRIEIIDTLFSAKVLAKIKIFTDVLGLATSLLFCFFSVKYLIFIVETGDISVTLGISLGWPASTMAVGSFLMAFYFLLNLHNRWRSLN